MDFSQLTTVKKEKEILFAPAFSLWLCGVAMQQQLMLPLSVFFPELLEGFDAQLRQKDLIDID